jgi:hypothetical protein
LTSPFVLVELPPKRISGGQLSLGAVATLLLGHAEGPRAPAGDRTFASQTGGRQSTEESARRQPENQPDRSDLTAQMRVTATVRALAVRAPVARPLQKRPLL